MTLRQQIDRSENAADDVTSLAGRNAPSKLQTLRWSTQPEPCPASANHGSSIYQPDSSSGIPSVESIARKPYHWRSWPVWQSAHLVGLIQWRLGDAQSNIQPFIATLGTLSVARAARAADPGGIPIPFTADPEFLGAGRIYTVPASAHLDGRARDHFPDLSRRARAPDGTSTRSANSPTAARLAASTSKARDC